MAKKSAYTKITPLPPNIPRQLALELLHSHEEVIRLNPLVTGVKAIESPRDSSTEEYYSNWYEISQIITWGFGIKSKYSFRGVFHDQPWGLQTHVYAPMGVDMRNKYRIGGNQPGEPREARELGVDTPLDGLYLREDVEITCNMAMMSFVKKEAKEATGIMISRLTRKAELLDEGKLHAMFEDGKLKTSKPTGRLDDFATGSLGSMTPPASPGNPYMHGGSSPALSHASFGTPFDAKGYGRYHDIARTGSIGHGYPASPPPGFYHSGQPGMRGSNEYGMPMINELPGSQSVKAPGGTEFRSELPGDQNFPAHAIQPSPGPTIPGGPTAAAASRQEPSSTTKIPATYIPTSPAPAQSHPSQRNNPFSAYCVALSSPPPSQAQPVGGQNVQSTPPPPIPPRARPQRGQFPSNSNLDGAAKGPSSHRHSIGSGIPQSTSIPTGSRPMSSVFPPDRVQQSFAQMTLQPNQTQQAPPEPSNHLEPPQNSLQWTQPPGNLSQHSSQQSLLVTPSADQPSGEQTSPPDAPSQPPLTADSQEQQTSHLHPPTQDPDSTSQNSSQQSLHPQHAQQNAADWPLPLRPHSQGSQQGPISQCPVCGQFEGDEAAVSHHVEKQHFA